MAAAHCTHLPLPANHKANPNAKSKECNFHRFIKILPFRINIPIFALMFLKLKKILSIFTLAVFLIPMVAEQLHSFEHRHDKHCTNTETHYCTPEHHCTLCDFVQLTSYISVSETQLEASTIITAHKTDFYKSVVVAKHYTVYPLRGPPTVS